MRLQHVKQKNGKKRSVFRALFVPLILIMILQAGIFYFAAVYGGVESSLSQNAVDILNERLLNRKNEIETTFNNNWSNLDTFTSYLNELYATYETEYGKQPFVNGTDPQLEFLKDSSKQLIDTLRQNQVTGVFLILNDQTPEELTDHPDSESKYGLCIRDLDPASNYLGNDDLLIERSPSSLIEQTGCPLDSWWEAQYSFTSSEADNFYYKPLLAVLDNPDTEGENLAYFAEAHSLSTTDRKVVSYSIPLISEDGEPYGVVGIELTTAYLSSLIPGGEVTAPDKSCYVLALHDVNSTECVPIATNGALYNRCFDSNSVISCGNTSDNDGFTTIGRGNTEIYGSLSPITIYNNNNPFEDQQLVLIALVEHESMFAYIDHIKQVLLLVSLISLALGIICILIVSRRFAAPITALARRVRSMTPEQTFDLDHLGITEIDQLVDSIEDLNENVSKNIARTEFFSRMSHDMRTPMNAIISFSSPELLEGADDALKDNYLAKIHSSGEFLLGLINEVLDMTKIESKKTDLIYKPMRLQHAWETVIPIIDKLAQKKTIHFTKELSAPAGLCVMADEQHLNQIIMNLLSNAVKFTPEKGAVSLKVKVTDHPTEPDLINCSITVRDTGIGISEEFMKDLYTPFEQEHEGQGGTGLGLSIAKKLVELMNGSITCESRKGKGTTFSIALSLKKCTAPDPAPDAFPALSEQAPAVTNVLDGKHILVCEDHPLNTQIICRLLEKKGITVVAVPNGLEGVHTFEESPAGAFDAILMDIRMPVMDGLEAAASIRALEREDASSIPILAMTANAFEEDVRASRAAGMNAHLSKPVEPQKLYQALESFLNT